MRFYTLLIFALIAWTVACSIPQSINSPAKTDEVVLEVVTKAVGMLYPKEGDILQMRLYESGRFEYDDFPDYNPPQVTGRNVIIKRKEAKLSPEEVKELIGLAEQPDFLSSKEEYPSFGQQHTDTFCTTKIKFIHQNKEKVIIAENFWDTQYQPEIKTKYPRSMVELLERVEELKAKAIGRKSTQWLSPTSNNSLKLKRNNNSHKQYFINQDFI